LRSDALWRTAVASIEPMPAKKKNKRPVQAPRSAPTRKPPAFITPLAAQVVKTLPEDDDWIYELKFDGYRALIIKDKQRVELRSRKNKDLAGMYPGIAAAGLRLSADQAVVDGEIVALDAQGSPSFQALQHRGSHPPPMSPRAGETGERSLTRCERIALDFHIDEPLREDADRGTPQQHHADLRGDVRPQDEFAGG
jgi:ATP-dependent DNA ligase